MKDLVLRLLMNNLLWNKKNVSSNTNDIQYNPISNYEWNGVVNHLTSKFPETIIEIISKILDNYDKMGSYVPTYEESKLIISGMKMYPNLIGKKILNNLGPPIDSKAFKIRILFREIKDRHNNANISILNYFKPETIWNWIDEDINNRAPYFAGFVPPALFHTDNGICWAREILVKYGTMNEFRQELISNFLTFMFTGSISYYYKEVVKSISDYKKKETNRNVSNGSMNIWKILK
jgi:hypothetical protein